MASRPILSPYSVITNGNMSGNLISEVTIIQTIDRVSYDVSWAGSAPVGTLAVQVSNSYSQYADGSVQNAGDWNTIMTSPVSGSTGSGFFDVTQTAGFAVRLIYTAGSGSGLLQAIVSGKA